MLAKANTVPVELLAAVHAHREKALPAHSLIPVLIAGTAATVANCCQIVPICGCPKGSKGPQRTV